MREIVKTFKHQWLIFSVAEKEMLSQRDAIARAILEKLSLDNDSRWIGYSTRCDIQEFCFVRGGKVSYPRDC